MAYEIPGRKISLPAGEDLSDKQFHFVKVGVGASGEAVVLLAAAATDKVLGVLQNKPALGETAEIMTSGISKVVVGNGVTAGAEVTSVNGQAKESAGGEYVCGIALGSAAAAGEIIPVELKPIGYKPV